MRELLINTWHCDTCEYVFYVNLSTEIDPNNCPHCGSDELSDSQVLEAMPLQFKK